MTLPAARHQRPPPWRDERVLNLLGQAVFVAALAAVGYLLYNNARMALERQGMVAGFGFLQNRAGFDIGEGLRFSPAESYGRAFVVGITNTLRVIGLGIALATGLGLVAGVARLSTNWLVARAAAVYVELIRNTPILLQLFFWYFAVALKLPRVPDSIVLPGPVVLNLRGISLPWALPTETFEQWRGLLLAGLAAAALAWLAAAYFQRRSERPGGWAPLAGLITLLLAAAGAWAAVGEAPLHLDLPERRGLNYGGGVTLSPEYWALLVGLVVYTGAFIAEIVRAGIQAVSRGQVEAARALGLGPMLVLRLVVLPQALRVIIPPLTSQYLNLAKNSSLAVAIGYPDLFSVGGTIFNQTGRAIEMISLIMVSYLTMSLLTSLALNLYNRRVRLVER